MAVFIGTIVGETLNGTPLDDYMAGYEGDDTLIGAGGNDFIYAGEGSDLVFDGNGADMLFGEAGEDRFVMGGLIDGGAPDGADAIDGGVGSDTVRYTLYAITGGERVSNALTQVDLLNGSNNLGMAVGDTYVSIENYIGGRGRDVVYGTDGANWFAGSLGNDTYYGRDGYDMYSAWLPETFPEQFLKITFEIAFGARAAELAERAQFPTIPGNGAIAYYEIWNDANSNAIKDAGEVTHEADLLHSIEYFVGTVGDDVIRGSAADETVNPLGGNDTLDGGAGFDVLSYEEIRGHGVGFGATVDLGLGTAGRGNGTATITGFEAVVGSQYSDQILGSSVANRLSGGMGNDALNGRGGDDDLAGGDGSDILTGGLHNDVLSGGGGRDVLDGGAGIDTISYADARTSIAVSLLRGQGLDPVIDDVRIPNTDSAADVILGVENVIGSRFIDVIGGGDNNNLIEGRTGADTIFGFGGNDILYGDLDPNSRVPVFVDPAALDDDVLIAGQGGTPEVSDDDIINGGTGNDQLFGQGGSDQLLGADGFDVLYGGDGSDVLDGEAGNDTLDGGLGSDIIYGGSGNDGISGGAGFDFILAGAGVDTVSYAASGAGVTVNLGEFWLNAGGDASGDLIEELTAALIGGEDPSQVLESITFLSLMQLIGGEDAPGFTLSLPDVIMGAENILGSAFDDTLTGDGMSNNLAGGTGNDRLFGLEGDDVLDGGVGVDRLEGGAGNDLYIVAGDDVVIEAVGAGIDTVQSAKSFNLEGQELENLTLTGAGGIGGTGNALNNRITGNASNNVLRGGDGTDTLLGGLGEDRLFGGIGRDVLGGGLGADGFYFDMAPNASTNMDRISDFTAADDTIYLKSSVFLGLAGTGPIAGTAFRSGTAAQDADDRIVYNAATGAIFYDADGVGGVAEVMFAQVAAGTALTHSDFAMFTV